MTRLVLLLIVGASTLNAVTPGQVEAVISVESSGNPKAIGRLGERGLCQFFPAAWADTTLWRARHGLPTYGYYSWALDEGVGREYATSWLTMLEERLTARLGRKPTIGELYAAHQLGFSGFASKGFDLRRCPKLTRIVVARLERDPRTK
jgi:hypothetical protein